MRLFHDEEDGNPEPVPGLPEKLPDGERILWQGKPDALAFAVHAFHIRFVALYCVLFALWRGASIAARDGAASEILSAAMVALAAAALGIGLLTGIAWAMSRATIYTITSKRVVLRYGAAIRKYVNIPFTVIEAAALKQHGGGAGSIALSTGREGRVPYLHLWPHTRPFRYSAPQPMLRAIPEADHVADTLCGAIKAHSPATVSVKPAPSTPGPVEQGQKTAAAVA